MLLTRCHHPRHNHLMHRNFNQLQNQMERLFGDHPQAWMANRNVEPSGDFQAATDLVETEDDYRLLLELPGVSRDQIKLTVKDGGLTISADKLAAEETDEAAEGRNVWRRERVFGSISRTFTFAQRIDSSAIAANYKDGVLEVTVPKAEEAKSQTIEVQVD